MILKEASFSTIMGLLWLILCLTYSCALADSQEGDEVTVLEKDLQDFVRRLTQQHTRTTQNMPSSLLSRMNFPMLRSRQLEPKEELISSASDPNFPFQSKGGGSRNFASSFASVKRPHGSGGDGSIDSQSAAAYASLKDVNGEENLEESMDYEKSATISETQKDSPTQVETTYVSSDRSGPYTLKHQQSDTVVRRKDDTFSDVYFVAIVAGCCAVGIFGVISAGFCFYRLQKSRKAAADVDYPAYGVTGPCKDIPSPNGDRKLAQSAQMYHYQHQKQQMIAVEKAGSTKNTSASDVDSEEENEEGDYTVYECPGLAPTGEMEVKNPLFHDDSTPASPPMLPAKSDNMQNN